MGRLASGRLPEEPIEKGVPADLLVRSDVTENRRKGTQLERIVSGNRHMMLGGHIRSEADVAACLARDAIADSS